jgi:hypothetical protein
VNHVLAYFVTRNLVIVARIRHAAPRPNYGTCRMQYCMRSAMQQISWLLRVWLRAAAYFHFDETASAEDGVMEPLAQCERLAPSALS